MIAVFRQYMAQIRRSQKAGGQMVIVLVQVPHQHLRRLVPLRFLQQVKMQGQNSGGLGVAGQLAVCTDILFSPGPDNGLIGLVQRGGVIVIAQHLGRLHGQLQGVGIEGVGDEIDIGAADAVIQFVGLVQRQPVAVLETLLPQTLFIAHGCDEAQPMAHGWVLLFQQRLVAVGLV